MLCWLSLKNSCKTSGAHPCCPKLSNIFKAKKKNTHAIEKALKLRHVGGESISTRSIRLNDRFGLYGLKWRWWHKKWYPVAILETSGALLSWSTIPLLLQNWCRLVIKYGSFVFVKNIRKAKTTHTRSKKRWNCVTWVMNQFQRVRWDWMTVLACMVWNGDDDTKNDILWWFWKLMARSSPGLDLQFLPS